VIDTLPIVSVTLPAECPCNAFVGATLLCAATAGLDAVWPCVAGFTPIEPATESPGSLALLLCVPLCTVTLAFDATEGLVTSCPCVDELTVASAGSKLSAGPVAVCPWVELSGATSAGSKLVVGAVAAWACEALSGAMLPDAPTLGLVAACE
jgi:hypothetical protein